MGVFSHSKKKKLQMGGTTRNNQQIYIPDSYQYYTIDQKPISLERSRSKSNGERGGSKGGSQGRPKMSTSTNILS